MSLAAFTWTTRARPVVELGVGDTRIPLGQATWDHARWDDPLAVWSGDEPTWVDITCDVHELRCEYGRKRSIDRYVPGVATILVDNTSGWADPYATVDPGALTMRPGRAIRFGVVHETLGTLWLFRGFVDAMTPTYDPTLEDTVLLDCLDALGEVNRVKLVPVDPPVFAGDTVDARLDRILDLSKWSSQKRDLDPASDTLIATDLGGQVADLLGQAAESNGGSIFGDLDGNVAYRGRDWQMFVPGTPVDGTIGNVQTTTTPGVPEVPGYLNLAAGTVSTPDSPDMTITGPFRVTFRINLPALPASGFPPIINKTGTGMANRELMVYVYGPGNVMNWSTADPGLTTNVDGTVAQPVPVGAPHTFGWESTRGSVNHVSIVDGVRTSRTTGVAPAWPDSAATLILGYAGLTGALYWAQMERLRARLIFPGIPFNFLSVPDAPNLNVTGDLQVVARIQRPLATSAVTQRVVSKDTGNSAGNRGWALAVTNSGNLSLAMLPSNVITSTTALGFTAGTMGWVRATRANATGVCTLQWAADSETEPTSWSAAMPVTGTPLVGAVPVTTGTVRIGDRATNPTNVPLEPFAGRIARVIIRDGATTVLDVTEDNAATMVTPSTFLATTGQTVTVNDSSSGGYVSGGAGTVSTPDPGVLPSDFTIVYRARNVTTAGFPISAAQTTGADPRSWQTYPTLVNTRIYFEATPDGLWANRQARWADRPIPAVGVDRTEAIAVSTNVAGRQVMTAWAYNDATGVWTAGVTRDTGTALTPFDVTTTIVMGNGFTTSERLYWSEMRTGLDPRFGTVLYRFDGSEYTGAALSFTDPRGRVWTQTAQGAIVAKAAAPIVQAQPADLVWRFDASEYPVHAPLAYTDPRGRTWTLSAAGAIVPPVPAIPPVPPDVCPVQWDRPFARQDMATRVIIGRDPLTAMVVDDVEAQLLYGIEPFERVDLLTASDDTLAMLANRILETRSAEAAPRVRAVTLDARTSDGALDLMSTVDVYKPSRYRCRLNYTRGLVFDAEHFATAVVHTITPNLWSLELNLDLSAPYEAGAARWDQNTGWDRALWSAVT